ncbi:hypothetical protein [Streptomyces sp. OE57]
MLLALVVLVAYGDSVLLVGVGARVGTAHQVAALQPGVDDTPLYGLHG